MLFIFIVSAIACIGAAFLQAMRGKSKEMVILFLVAVVLLQFAGFTLLLQHHDAHHATHTSLERKIDDLERRVQESKSGDAWE